MNQATGSAARWCLLNELLRERVNSRIAAICGAGMALPRSSPHSGNSATADVACGSVPHSDDAFTGGSVPTWERSGVREPWRREEKPTVPGGPVPVLFVPCSALFKRPVPPYSCSNVEPGRAGPHGRGENVISPARR